MDDYQVMGCTRSSRQRVADKSLRAVLTTCPDEPYVNSRPRPRPPSRLFDNLLNGNRCGRFNRRKGCPAGRREGFCTIWLNAVN